MRKNSPEFQDPKNTHENIPPKWERVARAFMIVGMKPAASTAEEAHKMVSDAVDEVENELVPKENYRMTAYKLETFTPLDYKEKKIYFNDYLHHIMFLGPNGSIDVRYCKYMTVEDAKQLLFHPLEIIGKMEPYFQKAGADGLGVWD
jgi:hypothetical protein